MTDLRRRIEELESIIEEQGMQVKRGTNEVGMEVVDLMSQLSMLARQEITKVKQESEKSKADYLATLEEKEKDLAIRGTGRRERKGAA